MQNIANVPKNFLYRRIHRHIPARLDKRIRIRFLLYENGMLLILLQCVLQQRVQHILFAGKMAVQRSLADAYRIRDLRDRCFLIALHRK